MFPDQLHRLIFSGRNERRETIRNEKLARRVKTKAVLPCMKSLPLFFLTVSVVLFHFPGQVKFHPASGSRSTVVMRDRAEDTSYWVEEREPKSEIHFFKNYATNGYLGKETVFLGKEFRNYREQAPSQDFMKVTDIVPAFPLTIVALAGRQNLQLD